MDIISLNYIGLVGLSYNGARILRAMDEKLRRIRPSESDHLSMRDVIKKELEILEKNRKVRL